MSSLLQFSGQVGRQGVRLQFMVKGGEQVKCDKCGQEHPQLWLAWRKPAGQWGHWTVFRYLGAEHVPDLSLPIEVERVPRGAVKATPEQNSEAWHG